MHRFLLLLAPFGISVVLAAVLQAGLSRALPGEVTPAPTIPTTPVLVVLNTGDRRILCQTSGDLVAADELELTPEDAPTVIARLCHE